MESRFRRLAEFEITTYKTCMLLLGYIQGRQNLKLLDLVKHKIIPAPDQRQQRALKGHKLELQFRSKKTRGSSPGALVTSTDCVIISS